MPEDHLSFKDRVFNRRVNAARRVKEDTSVEPPIVFPKLNLKFRKLDETGELVALWLLSTALAVAGGFALIWSPLVGGSLITLGIAGFAFYLLGCGWAKVDIPPGQ